MINYFNAEFSLFHLIFHLVLTPGKACFRPQGISILFKNVQSLECIKQSILYRWKFKNKHLPISKDQKECLFFWVMQTGHSLETKYTNKTKKRIQEVIVHTLIIKFSSKLKDSIFHKKGEQCSFYPSPILDWHKIKNRGLEGVFFPSKRRHALLRHKHRNCCFKI